MVKKEHLDFVIANDVGITGRGFDVETNEVFIVDKNRGVKHLNLADKRSIGNGILAEIEKLS